MQNKPWLKVVIGVVVVALLAVTAGPFIYIHFIKDDAPKKFSVNDGPIAASTASSTASSTTGSSSTTASSTATTATALSSTGGAKAAGSGQSYTLTSASQAGYRVVEVLFGQDTEGVGRTNAMTGSLTLDAAAVTAAEFTVDMTSLKSDQSNRDRKFKGEIMETSTFPTATFVITSSIELGSVPADGVGIKASATGDLTLHGVTKSVTLEVTAKQTADSIAVAGSTDVKFSDYSIKNPSNGAVTTQDHGLIEFLLVFAKG